MIIKKLYKLIKAQQIKIEDLEKELLYLRQRSDDNYYQLRKTIDVLTDNVNKFIDIKNGED